jgi:hypothetical protein
MISKAFPSYQNHNEILINNEDQNNNANIYNERLTQDDPTVGRAVDCSAVFREDAEAIQEAIDYDEQHPKVVNSDLTYIDMTSDCQVFIDERGYMMEPMNEEESNFPIAYSILSYKEVESTERLLRAIYRVQNVYCIHVDEKSDGDFKRGLAAVASCFPNVFMSSRSIPIQWSEWSLVEAELVCMKDLVQFSNWRYHINLTGQEFPLKTNLELVQMLTAFNGSNLLEAINKKRFVIKSSFCLKM